MLPSESDLARVIGHDVDPLAIHKARKGLRKAIGTQAARSLPDVYRRMEGRGPTRRPPVPQAGGRCATWRSAT